MIFLRVIATPDLWSVVCVEGKPPPLGFSHVGPRTPRHIPTTKPIRNMSGRTATPKGFSRQRAVPKSLSRHPTAIRSGGHSATTKTSGVAGDSVASIKTRTCYHKQNDCQHDSHCFPLKFVV